MNKLSDHLKKRLALTQEGFTLVELIIALTLLGLVVTFFIPVLGNAFSGIMSVGRMEKALYILQDDIENDIALGNTSVSSDALNITFPGSGQISVSGQEVSRTTTYTYGSAHKEISLTIFLPNSLQ